MAGEVAPGCLKTNPVWNSCRFDILAFTIPREKVISSKIDRSAMRGVDSFEDGFAQGWMRVNCC